MRRRPHDGVGDAGGQEHPVAGRQVEALAVDVEHGLAGQDRDPLVVVLQMGLRPVGRRAQDLLDDDVAVGQDLVEILTLGGCVGGGAERPALPARGND